MESLHHLFGIWLSPASEKEDEEQVKRDYLYFYLRYHFKDVSFLEPGLDPITVDFSWSVARDILRHHPADLVKSS